ncbi:MAG: response regulator [candidate division KSB1 bacterium]|nr:response regulator [candidate division KSB1 bacterium]
MGFYEENSNDMQDSKRQVLVIDDSEMNRQLLGNYFKNAGYSTQFANDGEEGLQKFTELRPAVTFLDIVMPNKSGLDLLKEIKEMNPNAIVIIVSSYVTKRNIQQAKEYGADWFLKKPFSREQLVNVLEKIKNRSQK